LLKNRFPGTVNVAGSSKGSSFISLIGSVFNIVLVEMDKCSGAPFAVVSGPVGPFSDPKSEAAEPLAESNIGRRSQIEQVIAGPNGILISTGRVRCSAVRGTSG